MHVGFAFPGSSPILYDALKDSGAQKYDVLLLFKARHFGSGMPSNGESAFR